MSRKLGWILLGTLICAFSSMAETKNGFDLSAASIPVSQIFQGGPPRDGIPSIDAPRFIAADEADFLDGDDRILGIEINGEVRAYPISILNWHEVVNDQIGDQSVVITYCPLCGTGMAFKSRVGAKDLKFGVSGLLYQSDVLLYDRASGSLWSQIMREAVTGKYRGVRLEQLALEHTSWQDWRSRHPKTKVLSTDTGFSRDYAYSPYGSYEASPRLYFDVNYQAPKVYHPKEQVLGIELGGKFKAYPFTELSQAGKPSFKDQLAGQSFTVKWNEQARSAHIVSRDQRVMPTTTAFWFAWYTFHPDTDVFVADK